MDDLSVPDVAKLATTQLLRLIVDPVARHKVREEAASMAVYWSDETIVDDVIATIAARIDR